MVKYNTIEIRVIHRVFDSLSKTALFDIDFGHETSKKKFFEKSPEKIFQVENFFSKTAILISKQYCIRHVSLVY